MAPHCYPNRPVPGLTWRELLTVATIVALGVVSVSALILGPHVPPDPPDVAAVRAALAHPATRVTAGDQVVNDELGVRIDAAAATVAGRPTPTVTVVRLADRAVLVRLDGWAAQRVGPEVVARAAALQTAGSADANAAGARWLEQQLANPAAAPVPPPGR